MVANETAAPAPVPAIVPSKLVTLYKDGLVINGRRLIFDTTTEAELRAAFLPLGTPKARKGPDDCPAGPLSFLDYPGGLQIALSEGKFGGYWADKGVPDLVTNKGVKLGDSRASLKGYTIEETSVGEIADVDEVFAAMSEDGKSVDALYAGAACIYD